MKNWPDGTVPFWELAEPLCDAVGQLYELNRKPTADVKWSGYGFPDEALRSCEQPDNRLTVESLNYEECDQGRDPMRVIIGLAIQFGIEQGIRSEQARHESQESVRDICAELHKMVTELKAMKKRNSGSEK